MECYLHFRALVVMSVNSFRKMRISPSLFDGGNLVSYLEALAKENGSEQYVEYLVAEYAQCLLIQE